MGKWTEHTVLRSRDTSGQQIMRKYSIFLATRKCKSKLHWYSISPQSEWLASNMRNKNCWQGYEEKEPLYAASRM
jgi:hypothetical protein